MNEKLRGDLETITNIMVKNKTQLGLRLMGDGSTALMLFVGGYPVYGYDLEQFVGDSLTNLKESPNQAAARQIAHGLRRASQLVILDLTNSRQYDS